MKLRQILVSQEYDSRFTIRRLPSTEDNDLLWHWGPFYITFCQRFNSSIKAPSKMTGSDKTPLCRQWNLKWMCPLGLGWVCVRSGSQNASTNPQNHRNEMNYNYLNFINGIFSWSWLPSVCFHSQMVTPSNSFSHFVFFNFTHVCCS